MICFCCKKKAPTVETARDVASWHIGHLENQEDICRTQGIEPSVYNTALP